MSALHRWVIVAAGVALLVLLVPAMRYLQTATDGPGARTLLGIIASSGERGYQGFVVTRGDLDLPVTDHFTDIGSLLGERTEMRVWWRSADDWRVDKQLLTGESDLIHDADGTTEWRYEQDEVTRSRDPDIRLPRSADLLPPALARRLLEGVAATEVSRMPGRRVAGHVAHGLRLRPAARESSIDHVDLWADSSSGVVLRVDVYGDNSSSAPAFTTSFADFTAGVPPQSTTGFSVPPGADVSYDDVLDIADAANQFAPVRPPAVVGGLVQSTASRGAVGIYGRGVTRVLVIPLREQEADPLREQLRLTPTATQLREGELLRAGPLGVLLTRFADSCGGWLVTGTVTDETLLRAAHDLQRNARFQ
jgi:hypothetical protein